MKTISILIFVFALFLFGYFVGKNTSQNRISIIQGSNDQAKNGGSGLTQSLQANAGLIDTGIISNVGSTKTKPPTVDDILNILNLEELQAQYDLSNFSSEKLGYLKTYYILLNLDVTDYQNGEFIINKAFATNTCSQLLDIRDGKKLNQLCIVYNSKEIDGLSKLKLDSIEYDAMAGLIANIPNKSISKDEIDAVANFVNTTKNLSEIDFGVQDDNSKHQSILNFKITQGPDSYRAELKKQFKTKYSLLD